ncbi:MAG: hypothetical protein ACFE0J_12465 [Elainellaceae cyanobacterium]
MKRMQGRTAYIFLSSPKIGRAVGGEGDRSKAFHDRSFQLKLTPMTPYAQCNALNLHAMGEWAIAI